MNLFKVETRSEALQKLLIHFEDRQTKVEIVDLSKAAGRILSKDLYAMENIPQFRRSMVDGYAVAAKSTSGASDASPILLKLQGNIEMGEISQTSLAEESLIYVPTGGAVPDKADAMVMLEYTEPFGDEIAVLTTAAVGEHIVGVGEDVTAGAMILSQGTVIEARHIGILATLGISALEVVCPVKVAILSTGDELIELDQPMSPGKIRDSNRYTLRSLAESMGCEIVYTAQVKDNEASLKLALEKACSEAEVILLSGGSSVGAMDYTAEVIEHLGTPGILTHGLAIKPGKPTISAVVGDTAIFGLPGHPTACYTAFLALVAPFLKYLQGARPINGQSSPDYLSPLVFREVPCRANFQLHAASGREVFQMVKLRRDADGLVADAIFGKSGMVSQMSQADAFVIIPMSSEGVRAGDSLWASILI